MMIVFSFISLPPVHNLAYILFPIYIFHSYVTIPLKRIIFLDFFEGKSFIFNRTKISLCIKMQKAL